MNFVVLTAALSSCNSGSCSTGRTLHGLALRGEAPKAMVKLSERRLSVSEPAAYWQFADTSHFTRAFKKRYGRTPTGYARSVPSAALCAPWPRTPAGPPPTW